MSSTTTRSRLSRSKDYFETLKIYTKSHRLKREDGTVVPWIDENLNPHTGDWIARTRLKVWKNGTWDPGKGGVERGKDYNHSTYCDLIITGLVGLRPPRGRHRRGESAAARTASGTTSASTACRTTAGC